MTISTAEDLRTASEEISFYGELPELVNTQIVVNGKGNVLVCEPGVKLQNSHIRFLGDHSVVYLGSNRHTYFLSLNLYNDTVFHMGRNNYINGTLNVILSEQKHCFIGDDCLFSFGIWLRTADPHLVYDSDTRQRTNPSKSIFIGDHVWIGQAAMLLKGTQIDSGSIIGAMSLVAGKKIPHNESWGGVPCRKLSGNLFWEGSCVHSWTETDTKLSQHFSGIAQKKKLSESAFQFAHKPNEEISFAVLEERLSSHDLNAIVSYLQELPLAKTKNRFVHCFTPPQKRIWLRRR